VLNRRALRDHAQQAHPTVTPRAPGVVDRLLARKSDEAERSQRSAPSVDEFDGCTQRGGPLRPLPRCYHDGWVLPSLPVASRPFQGTPPLSQKQAERPRLLWVIKGLGEEPTEGSERAFNP
jgi:hypothetical protein